MASQMAILSRARPLLRTTLFSNLKSSSISTSTALSQEPQLAAESDSPPQPQPSPLPPNPASGSPLYNENWRTPLPNSGGATHSLVPLGFMKHTGNARVQALSQMVDGHALMNVFADWMTSQRWSDMKQLFELWIRSLDENGKPNKPDVGLYNHYLRANLMMGATAADLLDLVAQMEDFCILPDTASFNLVLKAMFQAKETDAAEKLLQRLHFCRSHSPLPPTSPPSFFFF